MSPNSRRLALIAITTLCFAAGFGIVVLDSIREVPSVPAVANGNLQTITLNGETLYVLIADTEDERRQGLSGREQLAQNHGMLFIFPQEGKYSIWMKEMLFSIDILWIANDGGVIHIEKNVSPDTYPKSFVSEGNARYVLELPAGYAEAHGVTEGDKIAI